MDATAWILLGGALGTWVGIIANIYLTRSTRTLVQEIDNRRTTAESKDDSFQAVLGDQATKVRLINVQGDYIHITPPLDDPGEDHEQQ